MTIRLAGSAIPGFDHRLSVDEQIDTSDLSGEGNSGTVGHAGWKPALLSARLFVRMDQPSDLVSLRLLFHAREDGTDTPKIWEIEEPTANAMGVSKVRFTEKFRAEKDGARELWVVEFSLIESRSIPAVTDERSTAGAAATPAAPAGTATTAGTTAGQWRPEGWLETLLAQANTVAGKAFFGGS